MENQTKRARFIKVAGNRVQRLIDTFALLSNCSNKNNYEYTEEDVRHMFSEIDKAYRKTREAFSSQQLREDNKFKFNN